VFQRNPRYPGGVELDRNALGMHLMMVSGAEQHQVIQTGWPTLTPVLDVMTLGPPRWLIAEREGAPIIADHERSADLFWDHSRSSPNIQWLTGW